MYIITFTVGEKQYSEKGDICRYKNCEGVNMICRISKEYGCRAFLCIIVAGLLWGTSGLFAHYLSLYGLTSMQMTCLRGVVSASAITIYMLFCHKEGFKIKTVELILSFGSGIAIFLTATCYYAAMLASSVSTAVMLMYTSPVIVMLYSVLFFGEKCTKLKLFAGILMITGCILMTGVISGFRYSREGILLGLASAITYSIYNILTKLEMNYNCNPLTTNMYCFIFMACISLVVSNPGQILYITKENPQVVPIMLGIGVCTCLLPYFLYTVALKVLPAGTASSLSVVEPLAATVYSVIFLDEALNFFSISGILLVIIAVLLLGKVDSGYHSNDSTADRNERISVNLREKS